jgi:hypothetical protein
MSELARRFHVLLIFSNNILFSYLAPYMKKQILKGILAGAVIFFGTALMFTSCVRERDVDTSISEDQTMGQFIYSNAIDIAEDAATKNTGDLLGNYKTRGFCASIVHDKLSNPKTIVVDFGTTNCLNQDGRRRNGKLLISYTGASFKDGGQSAKIQFDQYSVDGYQVFGSVSINNEGLNTQSKPYYGIIVEGKYLKPLVLDTLLWSSHQTRTHMVGGETANFDDDVFEWIGTNSGMNEYQVQYASNITVPMMKYPDCRYFKSGKVEQQPQGHALRTIDYGDGTVCDDKATIWFNGKAYVIEL